MIHLARLMQTVPARWALGIVLALTGCGGLSERQTQHLADAQAGIAATQPRVEADPAATAALAGASDHLVAAAEGAPLPPPTRTPEAIAADPTAYAADAHQAAANTHPSIPWWGWTLGAVGAALGVVRCLPGPGGVVADLAWRALAPGPHRQADAARDAQAQGFQDLTGLIERLGANRSIGDLKMQAPPATREAMGALAELHSVPSVASK